MIHATTNAPLLSEEKQQLLSEMEKMLTITNSVDKSIQEENNKAEAAARKFEEKANLILKIVLSHNSQLKDQEIGLNSYIKQLTEAQQEKVKKVEDVVKLLEVEVQENQRRISQAEAELQILCQKDEQIEKQREEQLSDLESRIRGCIAIESHQRQLHHLNQMHDYFRKLR